MEEIEKEPNKWVLYEFPGHRLVLSVNCANPASSSTNIELDFEEKEQYMVAGYVALEVLANKVAARPSAYQKRHVALPLTSPK